MLYYTKSITAGFLRTLGIRKIRVSRKILKNRVAMTMASSHILLLPSAIENEASAAVLFTSLFEFLRENKLPITRHYEIDGMQEWQ